MSGGVDSSVAAALLLEQGWEVLGVTLRLFPCEDAEPDSFCCGIEAEAASRAVAERLGFEHRVVSAGVPFEDMVLRPAWEAYARGETPSPCPTCNRELKLGLLLAVAKGLGASHVATGHYARVVRGLEGPELRRGADPNKDQSYFLFELEREQLARALFPLGSLTKPEVRAKAAALGLVNAQRKGSQDACLQIPEGSFAEALRARFGAEARGGEIRDEGGAVVGIHDGLHRFTLGQRRGLGVALGRPAFVQRIDPASATVHLTTRPEDLLATGLEARDVNWLADPPPEDRPFDCEAQVRYRSRPVRCVARATPGGGLALRLEAPKRAVTPGQAVVLYQGDRVLGGAWITRALRA